MKRTWHMGSLAFWLTGMLFAAGCNTPALQEMKPANPKWAVGIVGSKQAAGSQEILDYTEKMKNDAAVVFDVRTVDDAGQAQAALKALAANPNVDLIVTEAKYLPYITELAKQYGGKKFGLIGDGAPPSANTIRLAGLNPEWKSFVAGFLAASINPKESVNVLVTALPSPESPQWRGLLAGIHYAGSSVSPTVVPVEEATASPGINRLRSLPGRISILFDPLPEERLAQLRQSGKWFISLHELPAPNGNVIAWPQPVFAEGVQEEVQSLLNRSWQGGVFVPVTETSLFSISRPELFPFDVFSQMQTVVDGLRKQTIQPADYVDAPVRPNRR